MKIVQIRPDFATLQRLILVEDVIVVDSGAVKILLVDGSHILIDPEDNEDRIYVEGYKKRV